MSVAAPDDLKDPPATIWRDRRLWVGLGVVVVIAAVLRFWDLGHGLPGLVESDEPTIIGRAQGILAGRLPDAYGWPTGADLLLAGILRALTAVGLGVSSEHLYLAGRIVFAGVSVALVLATGLLAAAVADKPAWRASTAWVAAALCGVGYLVVRLGRTVQPDELQCLLVVVALLFATRACRRRERWPLVAAGLAAGGAAGVKYVGGAVVVAVVVAAMFRFFDANERWRHRVARAALPLGAFALGVLLTVPALVTKPSVVLDGVRDQFSHQGGGHLGYDSSNVALGVDIGRFFPGNWGWVATLLALAGVVLVARRGSLEQRLVALYSVLALLVVGASFVHFPHYVLPVVPTLAVLASVALHRLAAMLPLRRGAVTVAVGVLVLALLPTMANDIRLLRAESATDTRTIAAGVLRSLGASHRVVKEWYTDPDAGTVDLDVPVSIAAAGDLASCRCLVAVSSYQEDRYRREPDRYRQFVAAYDYVRAHGRVVMVIAPGRPLAYDWETLPRYGMRTIPLTGSVGLVGPTITIYDLT